MNDSKDIAASADTANTIGTDEGTTERDSDALVGSGGSEPCTADVPSDGEGAGSERESNVDVDASAGADEAEGSSTAEQAWRFDSTTETREARNKKRTEHHERNERIKEKALDKTPQKLRHPSDLQIRIRTGAVYIIVSVGCILLGNLPMVLMLMAVAGICANEFFYMMRRDAKLPNELLGVVAAALYPLSVYLGGLEGAMLVSLLLLLALLVWYVFWWRARIPDVGISFFGAAYTGLLLSGLVVIRMSLGSPWGGILVLGVFVSVWANDAFAYLAGSRFGKHKMAPRISPKKSWEGFAAGLVASMLCWYGMSYIPGVDMNIALSLLFGLVVGVMSVIGDLAESRIKRNSGFKDSGTIMPGHGGLLDRSDSLIFASVTAAVLLTLGNCIPVELFM